MNGKRVYIKDQVERVGPFWATSTFFFESNLGKLRQLVLGPTIPLGQVIKRFLQGRKSVSKHLSSSPQPQALGARRSVSTEINGICGKFGIAPTGVYSRAKLRHKVFQSILYSRRGKSSSHICQLESGDISVIHFFVMDCLNVLHACVKILSIASPPDSFYFIVALYLQDLVFSYALL